VERKAAAPANVENPLDLPNLCFLALIGEWLRDRGVIHTGDRTYLLARQIVGSASLPARQGRHQFTADDPVYCVMVPLSF